MFISRKSQKGATLVEVVVYLGLLGIIMLAASKYLTYLEAQRYHFAYRVEIVEIRNKLALDIDCALTQSKWLQSGLSCNNTFMNVYDKSGKIIIAAATNESSPGTVIHAEENHKFEARARCVTCDDPLVNNNLSSYRICNTDSSRKIMYIDYALVARNSNFINDTFDGTIYSWNSRDRPRAPLNLFPGIPLSCSLDSDS